MKKRRIILGGHWNSQVADDGFEVFNERKEEVPPWSPLRNLSNYRDDFKTGVDITKPLPFKDNSIECVFTEHVIEHIEKVEAIEFMKESYRILEKDGVMRTVFPSKDVIQHLPKERRENLENEHGHKHIWSVDEMRKALESIGFEVTQYNVGEGSKEVYCQERRARGKYLGYSRNEDRAQGFIFDDESSILEAKK